MIRSLRDLDDYEVAELVRKKTEACVIAIVFSDDEAQQGIAPSVVDADGNRVEQFEPGLIASARGGKDIRFNQASATGGYGEYKRASLHTISAGFRVAYGHGCGFDIALYWLTGTVTAVSGIASSLTIPEAAAEPTGWHRGGVLRLNAQLGFITGHAGATLTLSRPMPELADNVYDLSHI